MNYISRYSDLAKIENISIRHLLESLIHNQQIFDEDGERRYLSSCIKYHEKEKIAPNFQHFDLTAPVNAIPKYFGFDKILDYQKRSWEIIMDRAIEQKRTKKQLGALIAAPTGFGKTEAFLGPIINFIKNGFYRTVVFIYPRKALVDNQLSRILKCVYDANQLGGEKITLGVWHGDIPYNVDDIPEKLITKRGNAKFLNLVDCWCKDKRDDKLDARFFFNSYGNNSAYTIRCSGDGHKFSDTELVLSKRKISKNPPHIILTTLESLETFCLHTHYNILPKIDAIVLDEIHLYNGLYGAHASGIINNISKLSKKIIGTPPFIIGVSATLDDPLSFATKIMNVEENDVSIIEPSHNDIKKVEGKKEHYFFMQTENGMPTSSNFIQNLMLSAHCLTMKEDGERQKVISFFDSKNTLNQLNTQFIDADSRKELWRYHMNLEHQNWSSLPGRFGFKFIDNPLDVGTYCSDSRLDSRGIKEKSIILATSALEVGIDVGTINNVIQYRPPWNFSSFIQRKGRGGRKGQNTFIFMFLGNDINDRNLFYRTERFLESDFRIPLNDENEVVKWLHEKLLQAYEISKDVESSTEGNKNRIFLNRFIKDAFNFEEFINFINSPKTIMEKIGLDDFTTPLTTKDNISSFLKSLEERKDEIVGNVTSILSYVGKGENALFRENVLEEMSEDIRNTSLSLLETFKKSVSEGFVSHIPGTEDIINNINDVERELRSAKFDKERGILDMKNSVYKLFSLLPIINNLNNKLKGGGYWIGHDKIKIILTNLDNFEKLSDNKKFKGEIELLKKIFYLRMTLVNLEKFFKLETGYRSNHYTKYIIRSVYYFNKFLDEIGIISNQKMWYLPDNYFETSGKTFTVFSEDEDVGNECDITEILYKYCPFKTNYVGNNIMEVFLPKIVERDGKKIISMKDLVGVQKSGNQTFENILVPSSLIVKKISDKSSGHRVVKYCPECYRVFEYGECPAHGESKHGSIFVSPLIKTEVDKESGIVKKGEMSLSNMLAKVSLDGVEIQVTPFGFFGGDWRPLSKEKRPKPETLECDVRLGFVLDTRGITWDLSRIIKEIDLKEIERKTEIVKFGNQTSALYKVLHASAHILLLLISDVSGVSPTSLFYSIDEKNQKVRVFEKTEGGQGIVDLFFDNLDSNPRRIFDSIMRCVVNAQIESEMLWIDAADINFQGEWTGEIERKIKRKLHYVPENIVNEIFQEFSESFSILKFIVKEKKMDLMNLISLKSKIAKELFINGAEDEKIDDLIGNFLKNENVENDILSDIKRLIVPPDIDEAIATLQLLNCTEKINQNEIISYFVGKKIGEAVIDIVGTEKEMKEKIFQSKKLPVGEISGKFVLLRI